MTYVRYQILGDTIARYYRDWEFQLDGQDQESHEEHVEQWLAEAADDYNSTHAETEAIDPEDIEFELADHSDDIPSAYTGSYRLDPDYWDYLYELEKSHLDEEVFLAGLELDIPVDRIEDAYLGSYDSDGDWAYEQYKDSGFLDECPEHLQNYIDWDAVGRDESMGGYIASYDNHYFRTDW